MFSDNSLICISNAPAVHRPPLAVDVGMIKGGVDRRQIAAGSTCPRAGAEESPPDRYWQATSVGNGNARCH
jgi:hypothetical protein